MENENIRIVYSSHPQRRGREFEGQEVRVFDLLLVLLCSGVLYVYLMNVLKRKMNESCRETISHFIVNLPQHILRNSWTVLWKLYSWNPHWLPALSSPACVGAFKFVSWFPWERASMYAR